MEAVMTVEDWARREAQRRFNEVGARVTVEQARGIAEGIETAFDRLLSDEAVEAAARALAMLEPGEPWPSNEALGGGPTSTRDDEYRSIRRDEAQWALQAAIEAVAREEDGNE
jgi:hypothetical protein